jgi:hypothetical protein
LKTVISTKPMTTQMATLRNRLLFTMAFCLNQTE